MKTIRKLISVLLACVLVAAAMPTMAEAERETVGAGKGGVSFGGYVTHDFAESEHSKWITFSSDDPTQYETQTFCLDTYAAAYYNGFIYGYVFGFEQDSTPHFEFYSIDTKNNFMIDYSLGTSDGEFVYAMAYNYADSTMYALCDEDHPYIATVNLQNGELTRVADIDLGSYLGLRGMAITPDGSFYLLTMSSINSRLLSLDVQTGALTEIGATGMPAYYAQSMTCDPATGDLYWAQLDTSTSNGLYRIDPATGACVRIGYIGPSGMEINGLYVVFDEEAPEFVPGDSDENGEVNINDALLALRAAMNLITLSENGALAADMNGNGSVDVSDALAILRIAMGTR